MQPSLKKNYIFSILYEVLKLITPFITMPYIARVLGPDGVGIYSFTHSNITYFLLFGALGTASYGAREIAQNRDDRQKTSKLFWEIELLTVMTSGVSLGAWIVFLIINREYRLYDIALTPFILSTMFDISWFFYGLEKVRNIVIRNTAMKLLGIALLFLLVRKKEDVLIYCVINSGISLLGSLTMWTYLPGLITKVNLRELRFKRHLRETMIYFIPTVATSIYTVLDKTLIGAITGNVYQNGYYEEATKVINIAKSMVFTAVNTIMEARMSYLFAEKKFDEIRKRIVRSMDFIYLLAFGAVFGIVGIAKRFVPIFLGDGFEPVIVLLCLMAPLVLIVGTSNCMGAQYYTPSGQRKRSAKVIVLGAITNLCLNLLFIPKYGVYGATVASIIAEATITVLYINMSDGYMRWKKLWQFTWKRLIAGTVMCAAVFATGEALRSVVMEHGNRISAVNLLTLLLQVSVGVVVYALILWVMKDSMLKELMGMARKFINRIKERAFAKAR